jgi:hypothetical protein
MQQPAVCDRCGHVIDAAIYQGRCFGCGYHGFTPLGPRVECEACRIQRPAAVVGACANCRWHGFRPVPPSPADLPMRGEA